MGGIPKVVAQIPKTVANVITGKSSASGSAAAEPAKPSAPTAPAAQAAAAATAAQAAGLGATGAMAGTRRRGRAANILMGEAAGNTNVGQKRLLGE